MELLALLFGLLAIFGVVALVIAGYALLDAVVLTHLWAWFIVPIFHLPMLTLTAAIGVSLVWGWLSYKCRDDELPELKTTKEKIKRWCKPFRRALVTLGIGYVVHRLMA